MDVRVSLETDEILVTSCGLVSRNDPHIGWTEWYKPKPETSGYARIRHKGTNYPVHVLVCGAFHGSRPEGHTPDHIDRDRGNNAASNLRWASKREQQLNRKRPRPQCNAQRFEVKDVNAPVDVPWTEFHGSHRAAEYIGVCAKTVRRAAQLHCKAGVCVCVCSVSIRHDSIRTGLRVVNRRCAACVL